MWTLRWKEVNGEERRCGIDEEYVRDTIIHICIGGVQLDKIEILAPWGPVNPACLLRAEA